MPVVYGDPGPGGALTPRMTPDQYAAGRQQWLASGGAAAEASAPPPNPAMAGLQPGQSAPGGATSPVDPYADQRRQLQTMAQMGGVQGQLAQRLLAQIPGPPNPNSGAPDQFAGVYGGNPALMNPALANVRYAGDSAPVQFGMAGDVPIPGRDQIRDLVGPDSAVWNLITQFTNPQNNVNLGHTSTRSVDQLGGANSAFFNNMVNQHQPYFTQARNEAVAAGKEGLGSLSGSGASNLLGRAVNRTLGQEQAMLAELAKWGIGTEVNRELGVAGLNTQRDIAGANINSQRGLAGLSSAVQLGMGDQGADISYLDMAGKLGIANQGNQRETMIEQGRADLSRSLQNQELVQSVLSQIAQNNLGIGQFNANAMNSRGDSDADRFLQTLLGFGTAGVGPSTVVRSPGLGEQLLGIGGQALGTYVGKKV